MTEYLNKSFSVHLAGDEQYRDNWEATFGKREKAPEQEAPEPFECPSCFAEPDTSGHTHHGPGCLL